MEATTEEKFDAAVKVIQSIPRNVSIRDVIRLGAFQPSSSLLLRFYGYYKQATMGPCDIPRPAFYDMMGKAKWDAWNKLGNMSKEEAMNCYVEELKNIIEAMPHTDKVSAFISKLGDFYELVDEKIGEDYRRIKPALHLNGDVKNRDNDSDPEDIMTKITNETDVSTELQLPVHSTECDNQSDIVNNKQLTVTSHNNTTSGDDGDGDGDDEDSEADEFCDTLDSPTESELINPVSCGSDHTYSAAPVTMVTALPHGVSSTSLGFSPHQLYDKNWSSMETQTKLADTFTIGEKDLTDDVKSTPSTSIGSNSNTPSHVKDNTSAISSKASPVSVAGSSSRVKGHILNPRASDVSEQLAVTVKCLQDDMKQVTRRLEVLEKYYKSRQSQRQRYWWPFGNLPAKAAIFFIVWPFIVHWLLFRRRSR